ncbi:hypothetical protein CLIB1423_05S00518 [[Candida] railenensis]|uniref:Uncharacterized protein n=1 Tax=[Candida] railenensis TaxID=45579 RepID=A0A9P0QMA9_9ASCO|nr:hypothetical protein CLIB1423_05S00518 [[Candida] railenensis]
MSVLGFVTGNKNTQTNTYSSRRGSTASNISSISSTWKNASNTTSDDIFRHLTIKQIQALGREYSDNIAVAKKDIHTLVGSKYRDLIEIAEDIDKMHGQTVTIDQKIADLSYQNSTFVSFSGNDYAYAKFDSLVRKNEASEVRKNASSTILKNLVNTSLISFNLKLSGVNLVHSASCIHYAKFYYSIEETFKHELEPDYELKKTLAVLKNNFNSYLENHLSSYVSGEKQLTTSSIFSRNKVNSSMNRDKSTQGVEDDDEYNNSDFEESYTDDFEEGEETGELLKDGEYTGDDDSNVNYNFRTGTSIENYLFAYIILNSNNPELNSMSKIVESFTSLRCNFLSSVMADMESIKYPMEELKINFLNILRFIEITFELSRKYFDPTNNTRFIHSLHQITQHWNASDVLGFHNWFENETVIFPKQHIDTNEPEYKESRVNLNKFNMILYSFTQEVIHKGNLDSCIHKFGNLVAGLKKLESIFSEDEDSTQPVIIQQLVEEGTLIKLLEELTTQIVEKYSEHFDLLVNEDKDIKTIMTTIKYSKSYKPTGATNSKADLFSKELIDILENDIDKYMDTISLMSSVGSESVAVDIKSWFDKFKEYNHFVRRFSDTIGRKFLTTWDGFTDESTQTKLKDVEKQVSESFWKRIAECVSELSNVEKSHEKSLHSWYYVLNIIIRFKDNILNLEVKEREEDNLHECIKNFDSVCNKLLTEVIQYIPSIQENGKSFAELTQEIGEVNEVEEGEGEQDEGDNEIPTRPNFKLVSIFHNLSTKYISTSGESSGYMSGRIFLEPHAKDLFIKLKNDWIKDIAKDLSKKITEISKEQAKLEIFANVSYLLEFVDNGDAESIVSELASTANIDDESVRIIRKGVSDFYKSNSVLFIPLSI